MPKQTLTWFCCPICTPINTSYSDWLCLKNIVLFSIQQKQASSEAVTNFNQIKYILQENIKKVKCAHSKKIQWDISAADSLAVMVYVFTRLPIYKRILLTTTNDQFNLRNSGAKLITMGKITSKGSFLRKCQKICKFSTCNLNYGDERWQKWLQTGQARWWNEFKSAGVLKVDSA